MKTLIIAEKPSLAREIGEMLAKRESVVWRQCQGYSESTQYLLSSFFGHLLENVQPEEYDPKFKSWKAEDLPIIPVEFRYKYKKDTASRGKFLAKLARECSHLVCATDPDREGEGIFRIWYEYENVKVPFKRLWATSLALDDLHKAWRGVLPSSNYDSLSAAQRCRAEADWLVGMNGSRAYTIAGGQRLSIGRVQTPTLALIVKRDYEVENFKEAYFYTLVGNWSKLPFTYFDDSGNKFEDFVKLDRIRRECEGVQFHLKSFSAQKKTQNPPLPFSMPELQKEANKRFGFSLDKTLSIAQGLYERKITSYPRTDSPYLPPSDIEKYYLIIDSFANPQERALLLPMESSIPCLKNTDASHTAIIPTGVKPQGLTPDEEKLFNLIVSRLIYAFLKPKYFLQYSLIITDGSHEFKSLVTKTLDPGFTALNSAELDADEESDAETREIADELAQEQFSKPEKLTDLELIQKKRSKPQYYTPASLLTAMINVGRIVESKEDQQILKEVEGLGTAATRDKFPLELERRGYIEKHGKYLRSTEKGKGLINWVKPILKSPELTALWERKLRNIEKGSFDPRVFRSEIQKFINEIVKVGNAEAEAFKKVIDDAKQKCPKCSKPLNENSAGFFCEPQCGLKIWKTVSGKKIPAKNIEELLSKGRTGIIKGFVSQRNNKKFDAVLILNEEGKAVFNFDHQKGGK
jgi:DNA topoisomerase-3